MAPEVVTRSPGYNKPADWWSFGIFTFDLLTGRSPFHSNRGKQETKERILRGKFHTPAFLTPQAQDLIRRLLRRPVERRLGSKDGATEVKTHDFFNGICWEKVIKKGYQPPFTPSFNSEDDVSNFDARFTSKSPRESDANNSNAVNGKLFTFDFFFCVKKKFRRLCLWGQWENYHLSNVFAKCSNFVFSWNVWCDIKYFLLKRPFYAMWM